MNEVAAPGGGPHAAVDGACADTAALQPRLFFLLMRPPPGPTLFPYTTLFRSGRALAPGEIQWSATGGTIGPRSEEHTSELQSLTNLVCRLLLEKKKHDHPRHPANANLLQKADVEVDTTPC